MYIKTYYFPELHEEVETFFKNYAIEKFVVCPTEEIKNLKPKEERVCRFCGLNSSQTPFESKPHIISELLGNKYLISDFECDKCNKFFGNNYENDLAHFLGISRTFPGVINKNNKIPDFNSTGYKLMVRREEFYGIKDGINFSRKKSANDTFNIDDKAGKTEIRYSKPRYTPIKVYKALLKIALSIIPEKYVADYQYTFKALLSSNTNLSNVARISYYKLPYKHLVPTPVCFLFKKKEPINRIMNHVFVLHFQNYIFQFPVPFSEVDRINKLYNGESFSIPICPPILFSKPDLEAKYFRTMIDLSSNERVIEDELITISFEPNTLEKLKAYNHETGEYTNKNFNANDIAAIYIAPSNSKISFPKDQ